MTFTINIVFTPINKATGNVAFICQCFYALFLIRELGLDDNNTGTNKTFIQVHKTNNQVVSGHTKFLRNKLNVVVYEENKKLSNFYWTTKLQNHPSKVRFIIYDLQLLLISKAITSVLKLMYRQIKTYNSKMHYFSEVKSLASTK